MISISISPNTERDDFFLAFKLLFQCFNWKRGKKEEELKSLLKEYFNISNIFLYNSGRSSLYCLLKALKLEKNDQVLLQAFTCSALVTPILWNNLNPKYVDIKDDFNIDPEDLKRKISPKTKVLIIQHTFGKPCRMEEIMEIVKENNLILIEDCAHALGAEYKGRKIGTFGDASFLSFSRDKVISSVYGGGIIVKDLKLAEKIEEQKYPSYFWIFQQLLHPLLVNFFVVPFYSFPGKYLLVFFQKIHLLSKAVTDKEKQGGKPNYFPRKMPNALASLACHQFKKIDKFYLHRKKIANFYAEKLSIDLPDEKQSYLRFPVVKFKAHEIIKKAWSQNILIGDWYTSPIAPDDANLRKMGYIKGDCPIAEEYAQKTINLPTHINISEKKAERVVSLLADS